MGQVLLIHTNTVGYLTQKKPHHHKKAYVLTFNVSFTLTPCTNSGIDVIHTSTTINRVNTALGTTYT